MIVTNTIRISIMPTFNNSNLSTYLTIKNALMACGYAAKDAGTIAKRLSKRKRPIEALNEYLKQ